MTNQQIQQKVENARSNATNANNLAQHLKQRLEANELTLSQLHHNLAHLAMRLDKLEQMLEPLLDQEEG